MILSERHLRAQNQFRAFAEREFKPELLNKLEITDTYDLDMHKKMAKAGFMGIKIPLNTAAEEKTI